MLLNTRNVKSTNQLKESTSAIGLKYIYGSVYQIPPNHPYTKRRNSNDSHNKRHCSSRSNSNRSNSIINTNPNTNIIEKETNSENDNHKVKLPRILITKPNEIQNNSNKRLMRRLKNKMKDRLIVMEENYKITRPSEFYSRIRYESVISLRNSNNNINNNNYNSNYNYNRNGNSNKYTTSLNPLSPISTNHNINTFSEKDKDNNIKISITPRYLSKYRFELESMRNVMNNKKRIEKACIDLAGNDTKKNRLIYYGKKFSSMGDIQALKKVKPLINIDIKKRKGINWNFFSREALKNNVNNLNLVHLSKYDSPMKVIQNESLLKQILMNNLAYMGNVQL